MNRPKFTAREHDQMMADIRALMAKHRLCPHTLHKLAEVANREVAAHLEIGLCIAQQAAQ